MPIAVNTKSDGKGPSNNGGPERTIGLMAAINIIVGVIIGSGIFLTPGAVLKYSGSVGFGLVVWAGSGLISMMGMTSTTHKQNVQYFIFPTILGALCFAELGSVIPRSGGEYIYLLETFSKHHRFWGQLPAFLCSWTYLLMLKPAACAVIIMTCAGYSIQPFATLIGLSEMDAASEQTIIKLLSIMFLCIITYINLVSTKLYLQINNLFTYGKLGACFLIIGIGIWQISIGNTSNLSSGFTGTSTKPADIAMAFYNGLWAFDGWSTVTILTEEIKRPERNILLAICIALPIVTALFVFMNIAYMSVLAPAEIVSASAVAVDFGNRVLGPAAFLIPLGVALSTFGCVLSIQFGTTRICSMSGKEGHFLEPMSYLHVRRSTPAPAVALIGFISMMFVLIGDVGVLIELASFLIWITYGATMSCVLILRRTAPNVPRPYRVPTVIPVFTCCVSAFLAIVPLVTAPSVRYLFALAFLAVGVVVYTSFVFKKRRPKFMGMWRKAEFDNIWFDIIGN